MMNKRHEKEETKQRRLQMVDEQLRRRGITSTRVLEAMSTIPREQFIPASLLTAAYDDRALPIGHEQTISQPFIVAYMTEKLDPAPDGRVLEVGTGTGYQTAVLAALCQDVVTVERVSELRRQAQLRITSLDITNVRFESGDGSVGVRQFAPYTNILVTAAAPNIPLTLVDQLVDGGTLVMPVGGTSQQTIVRVKRLGSKTVETPLLACRFVKLIGQEGWP